MQPTAHDLHPIQRDDTWTSWTHTDMQYAALVVVSLASRPESGPICFLRWATRCSRGSLLKGRRSEDALTGGE